MKKLLLLLPILFLFACEQYYNVGPYTEGERITDKEHSPQRTDITMEMRMDYDGDWYYAPCHRTIPEAFSLVIVCNQHQRQFKLSVPGDFYYKAVVDEELQLTYYETVAFDESKPERGIRHIDIHTKEINFEQRGIRVRRHHDQDRLISEGDFNAIVDAAKQEKEWPPK